MPLAPLPIDGMQLALLIDWLPLAPPLLLLLLCFCSASTLLLLLCCFYSAASALLLLLLLLPRIDRCPLYVWHQLRVVAFRFGGLAAVGGRGGLRFGAVLSRGRTGDWVRHYLLLGGEVSSILRSWEAGREGAAAATASVGSAAAAAAAIAGFHK